MEIKNKQLPPNYAEIEKEFGKEAIVGKPIIFTYGSIIYNPIGFDIPPDLLTHEMTHQDQQGDNPGGWWAHYLADKEFRVEQEAEAYGNQYRFICRSVKNRDARAKNLWRMASFLSSPMYGKCISHGEAIKKIRFYAEGIYKTKDE